MDIYGVWMMNPTSGTATARGTWTASLAAGGEVEGTWVVDGSGILRGSGFITGGELDGAMLNTAAVAGNPLLGWVNYQGSIVLPASR